MTRVHRTNRQHRTIRQDGENRQDGDVVLSWLTKVVALLAIGGLCAFDGVALIAARFAAADHAQTAAVAAADRWATTKNVQQAYNAAVATTSDPIETTTFTVATDGAVHLTLHHQATTLLLHRISAFDAWLDASETARGRPAG